MEPTTWSGERVAFFGGSFDPPHRGHLAVARAARVALGLDTVLFAPVGSQPLKPNGPTASFEERLAMTTLAIASQPSFAVSQIDAPKSSAAPNYTVDTLRRLRRDFPGVTMFCLMGADSFLGLRHWHCAAEIPFIAPLIVVSRPGQPLDDLRTALPPNLTMEPATGLLPLVEPNATSEFELRSGLLRNRSDETSPLYLIPGLQVEISASQIREEIQAIVSITNLGSPQSAASPQQLLPDAVVEYIRSHRLYR